MFHVEQFEKRSWGAMRIKGYTPDEIHAGKDRIVRVSILPYSGSCTIEKPEIKKLTAKQMQTRGGTYNFSSFGDLQSYGTGHFLEEDAEAAVAEYLRRSIERLEWELENKRRQINTHIERLRAVQRNRGDGND